MAPTTPTGSRTTSELPICSSQGKSIDLLGGVGEGAGGQADLDHPGQRHGMPDLVGDGGGDLVGAGRQGLGDPGQGLGPLLDRGGGPGREGRGGGGHGPVDVLGRPFGDGGHDLLGGRVDDLEGAGAGARAPRRPSM